jgi:hypothetical protein
MNPDHKTTPDPAPVSPPCHHATGYWIKRGESFRCYACGHQLRISEIAPRRNRKIELWKA